jgi:hypothetical protein
MKAGLIKAARESLTAARKTNPYQRKVDAFHVARKRSELKFKRAIFERALSVADFNNEAAAELQRRDQESVVAFLARCKKEALNQAKQVNKRHSAFVKRQKAELRKLYPKPHLASGPQGLVIETADSIVSTNSSAKHPSHETRTKLVFW